MSFKREYISLCSSYIQGQLGTEIPESLNSGAQKLFSEYSPEIPMKLQVQALKNTLYSTSDESKEVQYLERFDTLAESNYVNLKNVAMEDVTFIINSLAGITEDLDDKVVQLIPCQQKLF